MPTAKDYARKADQQWELAGLARQDGDMKASADHTEKAREYMRLAREAREQEE